MEQMMAISASMEAGERPDAVEASEQPCPLQSHVIGPRGPGIGLLSETSDDYSPVAPATDRQETAG